MTKRAEQLLTEALQLDAEERGRLAAALLDSVEERVPDVTSEQVAEWDRRIREVEEGLVQTTPWETVQARVLAKLARASR